jgi:hypothetical protein
MRLVVLSDDEMREAGYDLSSIPEQGIPGCAATVRNCAAPAAGSPSNNNGQAREAITAHNPAQTLPLPPVGTPAQDNLGAAPAHENCANA